MITVQGQDKIVVCAPAVILNDDHDVAWAERHIRPNPMFKWILGKYVEADNANSNMQYWSLDDLKVSHASIQHSPLNLLHQSKRIVGTYVDSELIYPTNSPEEQSAVMDNVQNPFVEALAVYWRHVFPTEYEVVEKAHQNGDLYFSMECKAESITEIASDGSEGATFPYMGPRHPSYSDAINTGEVARRFNKTHFLGGALIIPPELPGWAGANVKELSAYSEKDLETMMDVADRQVDTDAGSWQSMMQLLLHMADGGNH